MLMLYNKGQFTPTYKLAVGFRNLWRYKFCSLCPNRHRQT